VANKFHFAGFACLAGGLFFASDAGAALILNLNSGAIVVSDNGAGDTDPAVGSIVNNSVVGGFGVAISIATSNSPGTPVAGLLQISSLDVSNLGAGTGVLSIQVSDTGFTLPGSGSTPMLLETDMGGTITRAAFGDTVTFKSSADPANGQPAGPVSTPPLVFVKSLPVVTESFSGSNSTLWVRAAGPYSLSNVATVSLSAGGQLNLSGTTTATAGIPEPGALPALGLLAGFLPRRWRRGELKGTGIIYRRG
jgi:hypothetical protein